MGRLSWKTLFPIALLGLLLVACDGPGPAANCETFAGIPVCDKILDYYLQRGGPEMFGYPITRQVRRNEMVVQYFNKAVVQYPANNPRHDRVHLRSLGLEISELVPRVVPQGDPDCRFFDPYGHLVCMQFLGFFDQIGGERVLGYPISESKMVNGELVQDFENARLVWSTPSGQAPHVTLAKWGEQACYEDGLICSYAGTDHATLVASPIDVFVMEHGGEAVFGSKVDDYREQGGRAFQCYQNACFVWDINAAESVTLVPLGRRSAPAASPVPPPDPADDTWYCPDTGHSVILAFKDFFLKHGGEAVFGRPLTEFMRDGGDGWVQWFENVSFEWHPDRTDGERVQLTPLGDIYYRQFGPEILQSAPQSDAVRDDIVLAMRPDYTLLPPDTAQAIHLWAKDSVGRPLANVAITLYLSTPSTRQVVQVPPTNANGETQLMLSSLDAACGEMVRLQAVTKTTDSTVGARAQFTFWCTPDLETGP